MQTIVKNSLARYNFFLEDKYEAGIVLKGTEVKSVSLGQVSLKQAYVWIQKGEVFLVDCHISPYVHGSFFNVDPNRQRKLLLHKQQIVKIALKIKQQKLQLVPYRIYYLRNRLKLEFFTARPKKLYDKRETIKKRDLNRQLKNS